MQGVRAICSPETGIVDWGRVTRQYGLHFTRLGGQLRLNTEVAGFGESADPERPLLVHCRDKVRARF